MIPLVIQWIDRSEASPCSLCGKPTTGAAGPGLCLAYTWQNVCRPCGKQHAPALLALLDLAQTAEQVGRIGRHTLVPPLNALLDLSRAAEQYLDANRRGGQQAA